MTPSGPNTVTGCVGPVVGCVGPVVGGTTVVSETPSGPNTVTGCVGPVVGCVGTLAGGTAVVSAAPSGPSTDAGSGVGAVAGVGGDAGSDGAECRPIGADAVAKESPRALHLSWLPAGPDGADTASSSTMGLPATARVLGGVVVAEYRRAVVLALGLSDALSRRVVLILGLLAGQHLARRGRRCPP